MSTSKAINVRLPADLQKELAAVSRAEGVPLSELVRDALRELVISRKLRHLSDKATRAARKAGYFTEDEILGIPS